MSHDVVHAIREILVPLAAVAAVAFLIALVYLAMLLYANPLGAFAQEILYLRANELRLPLGVLTVIVLFESVQFLLPFLLNYRLVPFVDQDAFQTFNVALDLFQAVLLVIASVLTIRIFSRYTKRGVQVWVQHAMDEFVRAARRGRARSRETRLR